MAGYATAVITLDEALDLTRTGDVWLFRGRSGADRAIRGVTNAPVNHVGMALVVDDLPPLMWHAELGKALPDLWSGTHQRGVQLHDLRAAVEQWVHRYDQRAWLRQLTPEVPREAEDAALRTVARLDGTPFPSTLRLASRWLRGRAPRVQEVAKQAVDGVRYVSRTGDRALDRAIDATKDGVRRVFRRPPLPGPEPVPAPAAEPTSALDTAYCAEVVAVTFEEMGILPEHRQANWYDPGRFWSGDDLDLLPPYALGREIAISVPPS
ncbi:hypothetical protein [Pseudonocardia pini]|uniref:hypothetical protein n=1 Tax=Pseudonocardia pini TaxID=2758030 RepID=UPI0015F0CAB4|nr:hypothetical protein [Pseudonocardia pini]